ncbi:hypothetical protein SORBI_3001G247200 [Sorghum bicolor]|uniref:Uncharacterized protein n=1 Tax=Sorghum bicolor TaxID=4558 RepID=A0A1Z5S7I9_SORBI|nr:hypothetical protein SORBI_3001G247200 [Sorghum bicolor]
MLTHPPLHDGVSRSAASLLQRSFKAGGSVHTTCVIAGRSATATAWPPDAADMAAACPARTALLCSTVSNPSAPADRQGASFPPSLLDPLPISVKIQSSWRELRW